MIGEKITTIFKPFSYNISVSQTDGRTDGQTDGRTELLINIARQH